MLKIPFYKNMSFLIQLYGQLFGVSIEAVRWVFPSDTLMSRGPAMAVPVRLKVKEPGNWLAGDWTILNAPSGAEVLTDAEKVPFPDKVVPTVLFGQSLS